VLVVGATGAVLAWRDQDVWAVCGAVAAAGIVLASLIAKRAAGPPRRLLARQDQLVALAAHEARRPLARLEALAATGSTSHEDPLLLLSQVSAVTNDAAHTIDDLLTLGGLVASGSPLRLEPLQLDLLVADALEERMLTSLVRTDLSPVVVMGHPILRRVVVNLVDNALEHGCRGPATPVVDITVRPFELVVADRGPGIGPGLVEAVNDPLGGDEHVAGLGIGLTLVAWVVNGLGGEMHATNRDGGGLQVSVRLRGVVEAPRDAWSHRALTDDPDS
jgi:signal transduction histidine kinase